MDGLFVELAARLAGKSRVRAAHAAVTSEKERRRERVEVDALGNLRVEILRLAGQQHRVLDAVLPDERADADRILQLRFFLEGQLDDLEAAGLVLPVEVDEKRRFVVAVRAPAAA